MPRKRFYQITREDREQIYECLCQNMSAKQIGDMLGKDPSSISREIKHHRSRLPGTSRTRTNLCVNVKGCDKHNLCSDVCSALYPCARCADHDCAHYCADYSKELCVKTRRFPLVCLGCESSAKARCDLEKYTYSPGIADTLSKKLRSESRSSITLSEQELAALDADISPLIKESKQSVEAALAALDGKYGISASTVRRYIDSGGLEALRIHMLCAPSRKNPRKKADRTSSHTDDGRSYAEFMALPDKVRSRVWEADTVIGARSDRERFFTFVSRETSLLGIRIIADGSADSIITALDRIELSLDAAGLVFSDIFPLFLVDNGVEFSDPKRMERSVLDKGKKRCRIYYCDPYSSWQKPKIEGIHTLIRRVLPKGMSFTRLDQTDACLLASHINSYMRADKTCPADRAQKRFGIKFLECLGIKKVAAKNVSLKQGLI